ncbi:SDR family NAD(P)-dependent oxidoreductase, partial [Candidatus Magnetaquicoccus inordinatus]|uniref:SDR family NAD(P)-dependent oxidoreductase n=1 Tax=Candidatus Magnetaquicoccus inordinatus TaxID=2496818 RepID=UPI00102BD28A
MMDLTGKCALVTGSGQRIGTACAQTLVQAGVRVAWHAHHSRQAAQQQCQQIRQQGGEVELFIADLADAEQTQGLFQEVNARMGEVQILVNNAAIFRPASLAGLTLTAWQEMLAINLTAPMLLMQQFARQCGKQSGSIVNIVDQRIHRPRPGHVAYTLAKSALWTLTQIAAVELAPNIRVNAIAPGPILPAVDAAPMAFQAVVAA